MNPKKKLPLNPPLIGLSAVVYGFTLSVFAVDLVPDNVAMVRRLLWDACPDWLDLGLELGINPTTLRIIQQDNHDVVKHCFTDVLSEWLKMIDPLPSWEALFEALKQPSVGRKDLVEVVKKEIGVGTPVESDDSDELCWGR